nr:ribonuclease J [Spiroplasma clarkii]
MVNTDKVTKVPSLVADLEAKIEIKKLKSNENPTRKKINMAPHPTKVFALGGLEEVGKNTYCVEYDDEIIMLDAGVKFPDATQLGVSAVIPDFSYLVQNNSKVKGLFITHGHEDHIGGIPYLLQQVDIPVIYAPALAAALIRERLKEYKLQNKTVVKEYTENDVYGTKYFNIEFAAVNHSIPDAFGVYVSTPNGSIFSTGDYKFDWTPLGHDANIQRMAQWGNEGVELLMADSTNAEVEGYTLGERKVIQNIDSLFLKAKGRIIIASFASNVHRIQHIAELANKYSRRIVVIGRSIERIIKIIRQMGHLNINDKMFIKPSEIDNFPKIKLWFYVLGVKVNQWQLYQELLVQNTKQLN